MEHLVGPEARDAYAREFTAVQGLWEFLDPHESLRQHAADCKWLVIWMYGSESTSAREVRAALDLPVIAR